MLGPKKPGQVKNVPVILESFVDRHENRDRRQLRLV